MDEAAENTATAIEAQRLAIEQRVDEAAENTATAIEAQRLTIEQRVDEAAKNTATAIEAQRLVLGLTKMEALSNKQDTVLKPSSSAQKDESPLFVSTVFKSGTKLLEHIIKDMTGFGINSPTMSAGSDYESAKEISFKKNKFFIWHNVPSDRVKAHLISANAKPVFLIRNIYDLAVSQYFHFALDVDSEIGCSTDTANYFADISQDEGISLVVSGATSSQFHWHGFGYYLRQIQEIIQFSKEYRCHIIVYDNLVKDKRREIERLAEFLDIELSDKIFKKLLVSSSLNEMRKDRIEKTGTGKHFRKGTPGDYINVLKPWHYDMINYTKLTYAPLLNSLCEELGYNQITSCVIPIRNKTILGKVSVKKITKKNVTKKKQAAKKVVVSKKKITKKNVAKKKQAAKKVVERKI